MKNHARLYVSLALMAALCGLSARAALADAYFTKNVHLVSTCTGLIFCPAQDVEPELRIDTLNRIFVSAIRGVPAGTDLWEVPPQTFSVSATPKYYYRRQPDGLPVFNPTGLAPGGGDTDLAIGSFNGTATTFPNNTSCSPTVAGKCPPGPLVITSLNLATVYAASTSDAGVTYTQYPTANGVIPGNDRQWNNSFGGLERYDVVHDLTTGHIDCAKSLDGGLTWIGCAGVNTFTDCPPTDPTTCATTAQNNDIGPIVVDQNTGGAPILYEVFVSDATPQENLVGTVNAVPLHTVYVAKSTDDGVTWSDTKVYNGPIGQSYNHLFPSMAVDAAGHVYAVWSNDRDVFMAYSTDHGTTWKGQGGVVISGATTTGTPVKVTGLPGATPVGTKDGYQTHIFPWVYAGFNGGVDIVYYETTGMNPSLSGDQWMVGMAQNPNAAGTNGLTNAWRYYTPSDHVIHYGQVCENGIGCDSTQPGNRNLADDFQVALDPIGLAGIAFTDDHVTGTPPQTYFTKQVYGSNLGTPNGDGPNKGCSLVGTTVPSGTSGNQSLLVTVKKQIGASRGWLTLEVNNTVLAAGFLSSYAATSPTSGTFAGVTNAAASLARHAPVASRLGVRNLAAPNTPFTVTISGGTVNANVGGQIIQGTVKGGSFAL